MLLSRAKVYIPDFAISKQQPIQWNNTRMWVYITKILSENYRTNQTNPYIGDKKSKRPRKEDTHPNLYFFITKSPVSPEPYIPSLSPIVHHLAGSVSVAPAVITTRARNRNRPPSITHTKSPVSFGRGSLRPSRARFYGPPYVIYISLRLMFGENIAYICVFSYDGRRSRAPGQTDGSLAITQYKGNGF